MLLVTHATMEHSVMVKTESHTGLKETRKMNIHKALLYWLPVFCVSNSL